VQSKFKVFGGTLKVKICYIFFMELHVEHKTDVGAQNTQEQIGQNPISQPVQNFKKTKNK